MYIEIYIACAIDIHPMIPGGPLTLGPERPGKEWPGSIRGAARPLRLFARGDRFGESCCVRVREIGVCRFLEERFSLIHSIWNVSTFPSPVDILIISQHFFGGLLKRRATPSPGHHPFKWDFPA